MKKLILASGSIQRKKLLSLLEVPFTVRVSSAREQKRIKTSCANLVEHNALLKARDVASKFKDGVVIGADTVIYDGHKHIIGKPQDLKEAKKILRALSSTPHWVYTGVAVVDVVSGEKMIDHEKTKVFMLSLSDEEIDRYHKKVSPLDKSGGFDIEGFGSIFIHRIEGCYSNVIGLPIAKVATMLKKFGVSIL